MTATSWKFNVMGAILRFGPKPWSSGPERRDEGKLELPTTDDEARTVLAFVSDSLVLLMAAVFVYWLPIPQAATRIPTTDIRSILGVTASTSVASYDPYFVRENFFPKISIPESKPE